MWCLAISLHCFSSWWSKLIICTLRFALLTFSAFSIIQSACQLLPACYIAYLAFYWYSIKLSICIPTAIHIPHHKRICSLCCVAIAIYFLLASTSYIQRGYFVLSYCLFSSYFFPFIHLLLVIRYSSSSDSIIFRP